jgi:hypothetical protein
MEVAPPANDPCMGETYVGRCATPTIVKWCEAGVVYELNCVGTGVNASGEAFIYNGTCGLDPTRNINNCIY